MILGILSTRDAEVPVDTLGFELWLPYISMRQASLSRATKQLILTVPTVIWQDCLLARIVHHRRSSEIINVQCVKGFYMVPRKLNGELLTHFVVRTK